VSADGSDPATAWHEIAHAVDIVREQRRPVFLHLRTVRFGGHAGSDAEISYRKPREIEADYARDPLLATASCLRAFGASVPDIMACYDAIRLEIDQEAERLRPQPRLSSASEIMAPLAPRNPDRVAETAGALRSRPEPFDKLRTAPVERPSTSSGRRLSNGLRQPPATASPGTEWSW
jgi:2-oxoisovalerate dehydrogenase E1 component